jgi:hypothetical protein
LLPHSPYHTDSALTGHVLGLAHEHQRLNTESYINFECSNLADYEDVKKKVVEHDGGKDTMEQVCTDGLVALRYRSMATEWTVKMYEWDKPLVTHQGPFDMDSIM